MAKFRYKAVADTGETLEGEMDAPSQEAVVQRLQAAGHLPIRADAVVGADSIWRRDLMAGRGASKRDLVAFTQELATLVRAGLALGRALEVLAGLSEHAGPRRLVAGLLEAIRGGASLADAMAGENANFPSFYVSMVRAGEAGGTLDTVLTRLAAYLEQAQETREAVRSALIYPAILVTMAMLAVVILLTVVVPRFRPMFESAGQALPFSTWMVMGAGDVLVDQWWLFAGVLALLVLGVRIQLHRPAFRLAWDRGVLSLPLYGSLVLRAETARLARTLGALVDNGVGLLPALALARDTLQNVALAREMDIVSAAVKQGSNLTDPLARSAAFLALAVHLIRVGEETGQLAEMLLKVADIYDQEVRRAMERMLAALVPGLTMVLGLLIAGIIGSILAAILSVYDLPL